MANDRDLILFTYPVSTAVSHGGDRLPTLLQLIETSPRSVRDMLSSAQTAAFVRGLAKTNGLPPERAPRIAYAVLQVGVGEKTLAQLPSMLSTTLKLANDKAQRMATEIEKELFAPISLDFNKHLESRKRTKGSTLLKTKSPQPPNVLDLKDTKRPPAPPPVPLN